MEVPVPAMELSRSASSTGKTTGRKSVNDRLLVPPRPPLKKNQNGQKTRKTSATNNPADLTIPSKIKSKVSCAGDVDKSMSESNKMLNLTKVDFVTVNSTNHSKKNDDSMKAISSTFGNSEKPTNAKRSLEFGLNGTASVADESIATPQNRSKSVNDRLCRPVKTPLQTNQASDISLMSIGNALSKSSVESSSEFEISNSSSSIGKNKQMTNNIYKWERQAGGDYVKSPSRTKLGNDVSYMDSQDIKETDPNCICFRDLKRVMCKICGKMLVGRIQQICSVHPRDVYLLDINACPNCKLPNYLTEHHFPEGGYPRDTINSKVI